MFEKRVGDREGGESGMWGELKGLVGGRGDFFVMAS